MYNKRITYHFECGFLPLILWEKTVHILASIGKIEEKHSDYEFVSSLSKNAYDNHLRYSSNSFGMVISYRSN